ncbi:MAG TPA: hypothetical protein DHW15_02145, partial [Bacteroidetes bacterium]|nr:hypothetical protein [Bacteroidota bacterium]
MAGIGIRKGQTAPKKWWHEILWVLEEMYSIKMKKLSLIMILGLFGFWQVKGQSSNVNRSEERRVG